MQKLSADRLADFFLSCHRLYKTEEGCLLALYVCRERETILNHSKLWIVISYFYMVVDILQPHWSVRSEPFAQLNK